MPLPKDFAELLTPKGRRVLEGKSNAGALARGTRFLALNGLIDPAAAKNLLQTLERAFEGKLHLIDQPIPPESTWGMSENYAELLPKTVRVRTAMLESKRATTHRIAESVGLLNLLRSDSFRRFSEVLNGRPLRKRYGVQLLCYGPGDYSGPHNDHHPEDGEAQDGYLDVHLTFCNAAAKRQLLVYEQRGHLSAAQDVKALGLITAYRLPFWHYTTPLEGTAAARRFVLLGTFLDAPKPAAKP